MATAAGYYDMKGASKACGLSPSVIRMWETRYGWPSPRRLPNGYRNYSAFEVEQLRRVGQAVKAGTPISQIIVDGQPVLTSQRQRPPRPRAPLALMRAVEQPVSERGRALRADVERAAACNDTGRLRQAIAEVLTVRPDDRLRAVFVPIIAASYDMTPSPGLDLVQSDLDAALGRGTLLALYNQLCALNPGLAPGDAAPKTGEATSA